MSQAFAVTAGEPAGIGPDILVKAAQKQWPQKLVVIADAELLLQRAAQLNLPLNLLPYTKESQPIQPAGALYVEHVPLRHSVTPGQLNQKNAHYVLDTLRKAVWGCEQGRYAALITAPVHKGVINDAGISFSGHTEFLAEITHAYPVMMLTCPGLRVALTTTHMPLHAVAHAITPSVLRRVIQILHHSLKTYFGLTNPRILVCGLNPHAGEEGYLGKEEEEIIEPTLEKLRQAGYNLSTPLPADTLFIPKYLEQADAVLTMYHDQGLPVLKYKGFGRATNITLGLPIIRTSVDHGTALTLAATGEADESSLCAALQQAFSMAQVKAENHDRVE